MQMVKTLLIDCYYILKQFLKIIESSYEGDQGLYDYEMCKLCPLQTLLINSYFILKLYLNSPLKQFFKILESQNDVETILQNQPLLVKCHLYDNVLCNLG